MILLSSFIDRIVAYLYIIAGFIVSVLFMLHILPSDVVEIFNRMRELTNNKITYLYVLTNKGNRYNIFLGVLIEKIYESCLF